MPKKKVKPIIVPKPFSICPVCLGGKMIPRVHNYMRDALGYVTVIKCPRCNKEWRRD